ncbi:MAG TPA: right-handed parallel beta-helix repeat-containing protein [Lacisediminihabitans sp.]|uniref:right-handed parallel beta-helix repeat-containing protein n=1 Tax=Lacisediminihabitans sp. TaxID=2787631 RepID=UPI002ED7E8C2
MSLIRSLALSATAVATTVGCLLAVPAMATASTSDDATASTTTIVGRPYPGDADKEAAIVATEQQRIYSVRAIAAAARWRGLSVNAPYRVSVGRKPTLVLVERPQPYVLSDLLTLIPDGFVRQPDGSFLLSNDIIVQSGAVLKLDDPDGLVIHLSSSAKGFNSIVSTGGTLAITGSKKAPVRINAWDASKGKLDTDTSDGRAYVRVIGGSANLSYVRFDHLGFWSGVTGGLSLTGTDETASDTAAAAVPTTGTTDSPDKVHGTEIQPTGTVSDVAAAVESATAGYSYVTALLSHVTSDGNAYGLFVNGSDGIKVANSEFRNSLVDGIVLHRYVTNSTITNTKTHDNAVDGLAMTRAATGIVLSQLTSTRNGRDGISLNGSPLASGPNATGTAVGSYGNNTLSDSTASGNARYGIVVLGGTNVKVSDNTVTSNLMGIVVSRAASAVSIRGNTVDQSQKHGIALFDGVTKSTVEENSISGAETGVYLRGSTATIERNTVSDVTLHGITLVGASAGTSIAGNALSGSGSTSIDHSRATGVEVDKNDSTHWISTKPLGATLRSIFQPLTVLWIVLGLIVVITAIGGLGRRRPGIRHPYASHAPLTALSKGILDPSEIEGQAISSTGAAPVASADPHRSSAEPARPTLSSPVTNYGTS